jgi:hypothetical protein
MDDVVLENEPEFHVSDDDVQSNGRYVVCYEGGYLIAPRYTGRV